MLKLLRWLVAIALLAFLFIQPIIAGLLFIVWVMARMLYGRSPLTIIITLCIIAGGCSLFMAAVGVIPAVLIIPLAAGIVFLSYKKFRQPVTKTKPPVDDDVIEVEVISEKTIYK